MSVHCFTAALDNKPENNIVSRIEANRSQDDSAKDDQLMYTRSRRAAHDLN